MLSWLLCNYVKERFTYESQTLNLMKIALNKFCFARLVPAKLMREWRALFEKGMPLYEEKPAEEPTDPTVTQVLEEEKLQLLDEGDFMEYKVRFYTQQHDS